MVPPTQLIQRVHVLILFLHAQLLELPTPFSVIDPFDFNPLEDTLPHDFIQPLKDLA